MLRDVGGRLLGVGAACGCGVAEFAVVPDAIGVGAGAARWKDSFTARLPKRAVMKSVRTSNATAAATSAEHRSRPDATLEMHDDFAR